MRIAVACDGLTIAPRFVQCSSYMCYTIEDNAPVNCNNVPALNQPPEALPAFFKAIGASTLVTCRIDGALAESLESSGITVVSDMEGDPLTAVRIILGKS